jgi:hypothetical protein
MTVISYVKPPSLRLREDTGRATAAATTSSIPYSVKLINQSASSWNFFLFQQAPNEQSANTFSLVWFCSPFIMVPGAYLTFQWTTEHNFVWAVTETIVPGGIFSAGEAISAEPQSANTTTFSTAPGPNLSTAVAGSPQGSLVINDAATVPNNTFSVGIGMGEVGTIVAAAGPNLLHTFNPDTTYWIAAGTNVRVGTILDIATVSPNLQVIFPVNVYDVTCVLGANNQWTQNP